MKLRNVVWPVVILGAFSLAGACSGGDGGSDGGGATGGDAAEGGGDGNGTSGTKTTGGSKNTSGSANGGASDGDGGSDGAATAGAPGVGGAGADLCEGKDLTCEDDDNPCTEDECNPATGECGIPRTGTSCDDGMFCTGDDTCNEGECTEHEGDPCNGQTCNEGDDICECVIDEDCPDDMPGEWSECVFDDVCDEMGSRNRPVAKFSCTEGACVQEAAVENEVCPRETDGVSCDDAKRCTGTDTCKNGSCVSTGNPCAAGADDADGCWETDTQCRPCGVGAACGSGLICCNSGGTTASCKTKLACIGAEPQLGGMIGIEPQP